MAHRNSPLAEDGLAEPSDATLQTDTISAPSDAGVKTDRLAELPDAELLNKLRHLVVAGQRLTAEILMHLSEVEERRLHLKAAYSSLFSYCVGELGMSEDEACRRIDVARLGRRFPALFELLASGRLSLTVAALLKPYLTRENSAELLQEACGKSVSEMREALAARFPRPDAASSIRKLPNQGGEAAPGEVARAGADQPARRPHRRERARLEPTARDRYRVQFTATTELKGKLEQARDLMSHRNPSGDLARVLEAALDALIDKLMKERHGKTPTPRSPGNAQEEVGGSVSNATRREVSERDGFRCSFVAPGGRRCEARAFLEYDHEQPQAKGGGSGPDNVRLLCRAHNQLTAELEYGREKIDGKIAERREDTLLVRDVNARRTVRFGWSSSLRFGT